MNRGDFDGVQQKINESGADAVIKARNLNEGQMMCLHYAAKYEQLKTINLLADKGVELNQRDDRQWTALHFAAKDERTAAVELLF